MAKLSKSKLAGLYWAQVREYTLTVEASPIFLLKFILNNIQFKIGGFRKNGINAKNG